MMLGSKRLKRFHLFRRRISEKQIASVIDSMGMGRTRDTWLWCLHCQRAYQIKDATFQCGIAMCAYPGCDGDVIFDGWDWQAFGDDSGHGYPAIPEKGKLYPQYGESS